MEHWRFVVGGGILWGLILCGWVRWGEWERQKFAAPAWAGATSAIRPGHRMGGGRADPGAMSSLQRKRQWGLLRDLGPSRGHGDHEPASPVLGAEDAKADVCSRCLTRWAPEHIPATV